MTKTVLGIWDYNTENLDLTDPEVAAWYLKRKIDVSDWAAIDYRLLKKYLSRLDIDPDKKCFLKNFIKWHEHSHSASKRDS
ncbi:hypothetical protein HZA43_05805 [Candidatus Peregrinibacteria bacterium]|nr:hypothetical protein [Candidatus Peregrinibacteria bacterium]